MIEKFTPSVGVIVFDGEEVLLVEHTEKAKPPTGIYGLPAGRPEPGETPKQAAQREFEEETGLIVAVDALHEVKGNHFEGSIDLKTGPENLTFDAFYGSSFEGEATPSADGKTIPHWFNVNRLPPFIFPDVPTAIQNALIFRARGNF